MQKQKPLSPLWIEMKGAPSNSSSSERSGAYFAPLIDVISLEFDVTRGRLELRVNSWLQVDKS
jgi:hypothetical protein